MFQPLTEAQRDKLQDLCSRYGVEYNETDYLPDFSLPQGWVSGWVGGNQHNGNSLTAVPPIKRTLFVGVSPEGESHS